MYKCDFRLVEIPFSCYIHLHFGIVKFELRQIFVHEQPEGREYDHVTRGGGGGGEGGLPRSSVSRWPRAKSDGDRLHRLRELQLPRSEVIQRPLVSSRIAANTQWLHLMP